MYHMHENNKKNMYNARVLQVEKATFTPLVFSTTGGMGQEATKFYKQLAGKIANKTGQNYADVISVVRRKLRFELLKTTIISLRGYRGKKLYSSKEINTLDLNLVPRADY